MVAWSSVPAAGGEPMRGAAVNVDRPEVAFGGEEDGVAVKRGVGVVAAMEGWGVGGMDRGGEKEKDEEGREEGETARGGRQRHFYDSVWGGEPGCFRARMEVRAGRWDARRGWLIR